LSLKETPTHTEPVRALEPEKLPELPKPEFDERDLQLKLANISTEMIHKNLKKIVKSQKLSDTEMDDTLRRLLYKRLCLEPEPKPKKEKKPVKNAKKKFKVVSPPSSESDSDSD
jgi:hypothetical protein